MGKNVQDLRDDLLAVFDQLKSGEIRSQEAFAHAAVAGKIINSAKVELDYAARRKEQPNIPFLNTGSKSKDEALVHAVK